MLMGVAGSGKTTVGTLLASELGWRFIDGDDLHSAANVEKMSRGVPLDDSDRRPWLLSIRNLIHGCESDGQSVVVACSALKQDYRDFLNDGTHIRWVFLAGSAQMIRDRLIHRMHHFMKSELLDGQLEILEVPHDALVIDIASTVPEIVKSIRQGLGV